MRKLIFVLLLALPLHASELSLAREMLDDAVIRDDANGMQLARERLERIAAEADDKTVRRDAHTLAAMSALFESFSGQRDAAAGARIVAAGLRQAERAVEIDPQSTDAVTIAAMLRRAGPPKITDAASIPLAFYGAMLRSFNPLGAAPPEGVKAFDDLAARLDADRAATGRRFGLWDAEAHAWAIMVRMAQDAPDAAALRPMAARLTQLRPDFALGQQLADYVAERRFVAAPAVAWQPFLVDASGDGKNPKLPDVVSVDRAQDGDRMWYRVTFHDPLPRSFGVNLVVNRSGDASTGMKWWGGGSTFRFDRLLTAWITRDGDRYFGRVGVTDDDGARGARLIKIPADIQLAMAVDDRSVIIGVPRAALGLTDASTMIVAGGSHLVWNDDATSAPNSR
jgi:hypothetical protein